MGEPGAGTERTYERVRTPRAAPGAVPPSAPDSVAALPDLTRLPGVADRGGPGRLEGRGRTAFNALYFDTPDLLLAAHGGTLRRSTGGRDPGWRLRLPDGGAAPTVRTAAATARIRDVPAALRAAAGRVTGAADLVPVLRARTARSPRRLVGADGRTRVLIDRDRVTARPTGHAAAAALPLAWTELTVVLVEGAPGLLDEVERVFAAAGLRRSAALSPPARVFAPSRARDGARDGAGGAGRAAADGAAGGPGDGGVPEPDAPVGSGPPPVPATAPGPVPRSVPATASGAVPPWAPDAAPGPAPCSVPATASDAVPPAAPPSVPEPAPQAGPDRGGGAVPPAAGPDGRPDRPLGRERNRPRTAGDAVSAYLRAQVAAVEELVPAVRADVPDAVHRMRVALRRLRSAFRSHAVLLDPAALSGELSWLAGVLGRDRDREVLTARLLASVDALPADAVHGPVREAVAAWSEREHRAARADVAAALDGPRWARLHRALDALAEEPAYAPSANPAAKARPVLAATLLHDVERFDKRLRTARETRGEEARDAALHAARKAAKRARYCAEAAAPAVGKPAVRAADQLKGVQELLGAHQDGALVRAALTALARRAQHAGQSAFTYGVLYEAERHRMADADEGIGAAWPPDTVDVLRRRLFRH